MRSRKPEEEGRGGGSEEKRAVLGVVSRKKKGGAAVAKKEEEQHEEFELYFEQPADHNDFSPGRRLWDQRYYLCDAFWDAASSPAAPILFYAGNEGDVEGFVNNTGRMWELGREWGAMLVFAEHRYYGKSQPVRGSGWDPVRFRYLSIDQVLTDYVRLIEHVKSQHSIQAAPVVAFGGSYGGVLAGYLRMKFPNVVYAAVASSAPFRCNLIGQGWDPASYWEDDAPAVALFLLMAFNTAAMGSLPFASAYFSGDLAHPLPPWVMRVVCEHLAGNLDTPQQLLSALGGAVGVIHNVSGSVTCYSGQMVHDVGLQAGPGAEAYIYQVCSEFVPNESFFPTTGVIDMFWAQPQPFDSSHLRAFCHKQWGEARPTLDLSLQPLLYACGDLSAASNIILSNGWLDPWSSETFQLLAALEVVHAALGLVGGSPVTAVMQWAGRSNVLFAVVKYTAFIGLYPVGVMAEIKSVFDALPYLWQRGLHSITMPNRWNVAFDYHTFSIVLLLVYPFLWLQLYLFLFRQRSKKLRQLRPAGKTA
ncbi:hypothetical protein N2152v2_005118 [Parachlorella kessleri]